MATTVIVNFKAKDGKSDLLHEALLEILEVLKTYHRCHDADLYLSEVESSKMMLIEEWENAEEHQKFYADLKRNGAFDQISKLFNDFSYHYFEKEGEI